MILKSLTLNNIRSYSQETTIHFSKGSSLFEGDIGSGKSSILLAIEFALFGLGDIEGTHLLRAGEKEGWVELIFEVDGKEFTTFRSLARRRSSVYQKEGYIMENGFRTDYSVSEMKSRVLQILDFREREQPRTSSLIYRYAVFTPQEMMKEVLLQRPDTRLDTLRRAFGIEEYSSARKNSEIISVSIRGRARFLEGATKDLPDLRSSLSDETDNRRTAEQDYSKTEKSVAETNQVLVKLGTQIDVLQPRKEKAIQLQEAIPHLKEDIENKEVQLKGVKDRIQRLEEDITKIKVAEKRLTNLRPLYRSYISKKKRRRTLEKSVAKFATLERRKAKLEEAIQREEKHLQKSIQELSNGIDELDKSIAKKDEDLKGITEKENEERLLIEEIKPLNEISDTISGLIEETARTQHQKNAVEELGEQIEALRRSIATREEEIRDLPELREKEKRLLEDIKPLESTAENIRGFQEQISEARGQIGTKRNEVKTKIREWKGIEKIGTGAPCPRCKQTLTPKHFKTVKQEYENETAAVEEAISELERSIASLELQKANLIDTKNTLEDKKGVLEELGKTLARLTERESTVTRDKASLEEMQRRCSSMESLGNLQKTIISLENRKTELELQKTHLQQRRERLEALRRSLAELRERTLAIAADRVRLDDMKKRLASSELLLKEQTFADKERKDLAEVLVSQGALKKEVAEYEGLKQVIEDLETQRIEAQYTESKSEASRKAIVTQDMRRSRNEQRDLLKRIKDRGVELEEKTSLYERDKDVINEIDDLEGEKRGVNEQLVRVKEDAASIRQKIRSAEARIKEIEASVEAKEGQMIKRQILEQIRIWMEEPFALCLQDIEIHVLASIQGEFDQLFQRWFNTLIETADITVRIDPEFTPITEQGGYELEYGSLSGGERTAVALAYRFALNTIVKRVCEAMRSNLLILDEPTDGFSKEQLTKLRDVLNELNCEQIIMVSHERELEGFVDQVQRITKDGGISRIQTLGAQ